jgi:hypothetical protein
MSKSTKTCCLLVAVSLCLCACSTNWKATASRAKKEAAPTDQLSSRLEKVAKISKQLNRIECLRECNQEFVNQASQKCLENGFSSEPPDAAVTSARDVKELISFEYHYETTRNIYKDTTDSSGVVTTTLESVEPVPHTSLERVYCIGSEYILQ